MPRSANRPWPCGAIFDVPQKKVQLGKLEQEISRPDFWSQPEKSQKVMQERKRLEQSLADEHRIATITSDLDTLFELAREGEDVTGDIAREMKSFSELLEKVETAMLLSGGNDARSAIVTIHPGAGGTESQDWAEMLLRMYLRWAGDRGFQADLIEASPGEEAGLKSTTMTMKGENAYGVLKAERGVHRLVRQSPFDSAHRRHTAFACVRSWRAGRAASPEARLRWSVGRSGS
jgi:peptide chain release factor 2